MTKNTNLPSPLEVLKAISDYLCMDILTAISDRVTNPDHLMRILNISHKEYYSQSYRLARLGLIDRKNGKIILTSFGRVVFDAQMKIASAFSYSSELTMIDAMKSHSRIPEDEHNKIIDKIKDSELKKLIAAS